MIDDSLQPLSPEPTQDPQPVATPAPAVPLWEQVKQAHAQKVQAEFDRQFNPTPKDLEQSMLASVRGAASLDPTLISTIREYAKAAGVSPIGAENDVAVLKSMARERQLVDQQVALRNPALAKWLSNQEMAAISEDDVDNLVIWDSWFANVGRQLRSGVRQTQLGFMGASIAASETGKPTARQAREIAGMQLQIAKAQDDAGWTTAMFNPVGQMLATVPIASAAAWAGARSTAAFTKDPRAIALGGTIGGGLAVWGSTAVIEGGNHYLDLIRRGIDPANARKVASYYGIAAGALETIGAGIVTRPMRAMLLARAAEKAGQILTKRTKGQALRRSAYDWFEGAAGEVTTEVAQKIAENLATASAIAMQGRSWQELTKTPEDAVKWGDELGETFAATLMAMVPLGGILPGVRVMHDLRQLRRASGEQSFMQGMRDRLKDLKTPGKSPDGFHDLLKEQAAKLEAEGGPTTVHVDRHAATQVLNQADEVADQKQAKAAGMTAEQLRASRAEGTRGAASEELAKVLPEVAAQLNDSNAATDTIEIPLHLWISKVMGTPLEDVLRDHIKLDPNGHTYFESQVLGRRVSAELATMRKTVKEQGAAAEQWQAEADEIEAELAKALVGTKVHKLTGRNSATTAQVVTAIVVNRAKRAKQTPKQFWSTHGVRYLSELTDPDGVRAALDSAMGRGPRPTAPRPPAPTTEMGGADQIRIDDEPGAQPAPTEESDPDAEPDAPAPQTDAQPVPMDSLRGVLQHYETVLGDPQMADTALRVLSAAVGPEGIAEIRAGSDPVGTTPESIRALVLAIEDAGMQERDALNEAEQNSDAVFDQTVEFLRRSPESRRRTLARLGLKPKPDNKPHSTREVAAFLTARQRQKYGEIPADKEGRTDEQAKKIANWMVAEVEYEAESPNSAIGWYTKKFQAALSRLSSVFPELRESADARATITALVAITSDGLAVGPNFLFAAELYENWRPGGKTPKRFTSIRKHNRVAPLATLKRLEALYAEMTPSRAHELLLREGTVKELKAMAKAEGWTFKPGAGYLVTTRLPYSAIAFGPKIGAFWANLMGSTGYLTMDRWWCRTFNRYRGDMVLSVGDQALAAWAELLGRSDLSRDQLISETVVWEERFAQRNWKTQLAVLAGKSEPGKKGEKAEWMKKAKELAGARFDELLLEHKRERKAHTIWKLAFQSLRDAPDNATDREFMIRAAAFAQAKLKKRGTTLSIADIQAALWYFEKRLFATVGARPKFGISYEEAAENVVTAAQLPARSDGLAGLARMAAETAERVARLRAEKARRAAAKDGGSVYVEGEEQLLAESDESENLNQSDFVEQHFRVEDVPTTGFPDRGDILDQSVDDIPGGVAPGLEVLIDFTTDIDLDAVEKVRIGRRTIKSPAEAAEAAAHLALSAREQIQGIVTDDQGKVMGIVGGFRGGPVSTNNDPTVLLDLALIKGAAKVWWVHNHPSDDETLSKADLKSAASLHRILSGTNIFSMGIIAIRAADKNGDHAWHWSNSSNTDQNGGSTRVNKGHTVPFLERVIRSVDTSPRMLFGQDVDDLLRASKAKGRDGILLLDPQNRPLGFIGIDGQAMMELTQQGRQHTLMAWLGLASAYSAIVVRSTGTAAGAANVGMALLTFGIQLQGFLEWSPKFQEYIRSTPQAPSSNIFYQEDIDYRGLHRAPMRDYGAPLHDLTQMYPDDVYGPKGAQFYGGGGMAKDRALDEKAMDLLRSLRGQPDARVTVYRAVPLDAPSAINAGDWVTITEAYAKQHGESALRGEYRIVQLTVAADELFTDANSLHEQGYDPRPEVLFQEDTEPPAPPRRDDRQLFAMKNINYMPDLVGELGFLAPSIGVANINSPYTDFGNATLIGPWTLVNPHTTPVFSADSWSETFAGSIRTRTQELKLKKGGVIGTYLEGLAEEMERVAEHDGLLPSMVRQWIMKPYVPDNTVTLRILGNIQQDHRELGFDTNEARAWLSRTAEWQATHSTKMLVATTRSPRISVDHNTSTFNQVLRRMDALAEENTRAPISNANRALLHNIVHSNLDPLSELVAWAWHHRELWTNPRNGQVKWSKELEAHAKEAGWWDLPILKLARELWLPNNGKTFAPVLDGGQWLDRDYGWQESTSAAIALAQAVLMVEHHMDVDEFTRRLIGAPFVDVETGPNLDEWAYAMRVGPWSLMMVPPNDNLGKVDQASEAIQKLFDSEAVRTIREIDVARGGAAKADWREATAENLAIAMAKVKPRTDRSPSSIGELRAHLAQRFDTWQQMMEQGKTIVSGHEHRVSLQDLEFAHGDLQAVMRDAYRKERADRWRATGANFLGPDLDKTPSGFNTTEDEAAYQIAEKVLSQLAPHAREDEAAVRRMLLPLTAEPGGRMLPLVPTSGLDVIVPKLIAFAKAAREHRVDYFEAKPQRVVAIREFTGYVTHEKDNVPQWVTDNALNVYKYGPQHPTLTTQRDAIQAAVRALESQNPGSILFQEEDVADPYAPGEFGFYSALRQHILLAGREMTAGQWLQELSMLRNQNRIKQGELDWTGIEDKLLDMKASDPSRKLSPQHVEAMGDFLSVESVHHGLRRDPADPANEALNPSQQRAPVAFENVLANIDALLTSDDWWRNNIGEEELFANDDDASRARALLEDIRWQVARGEELDSEAIDDAWNELADLQFGNDDDLSLIAGQLATLQEGTIDGAGYETIPAGDSDQASSYQSDAPPGPATDPWEFLINYDAKGAKVYQSSHWDDANVLVHVRGDNRTLADGTEAMLVHEVQSDWAQEGTREGFEGELATDELRLELLETLWTEPALGKPSVMVPDRGPNPAARLLTVKNDEELQDWLKEATKRIEDLDEGGPNELQDGGPQVALALGDIRGLAKMRAKDMQNGESKAQQRLEQLRAEHDKLRDRAHGGARAQRAPDGPIVGSNAAAIELGVKRAIQAAVGAGAKHLALTTGLLQDIKNNGNNNSVLLNVEVPIALVGNSPDYDQPLPDEFKVLLPGTQVVQPLETWLDNQGVPQEEWPAVRAQAKKKWDELRNGKGTAGEEANLKRNLRFQLHATLANPIVQRDKDRAVTYDKLARKSFDKWAKALGGTVVERPLIYQEETAGSVVERPEMTTEQLVSESSKAQAGLQALHRLTQRAIAESTNQSAPMPGSAQWLREGQTEADLEGRLAGWLQSDNPGSEWDWRQSISQTERVVFNQYDGMLRELVVEAIDNNGGEVSAIDRERWGLMPGDLLLGLESRINHASKKFPALHQALVARNALKLTFDQMFMLGWRPTQTARSTTPVIKEQTTPVPVLELTPQVEANVRAGMPLWSREGTRRGAFLPELFLVLLFRGANLSTILHEMSHWYLVDLMKTAKSGQATAEELAELNAILGWMGIGSVEEFDALPADQRTALHEQWAYMFEVFLAEGQAPSLALQEAFGFIRQWMVDIYGDTAENRARVFEEKFGRPMPTLDPQARHFFQRMMATDQEIAEAEAVRELLPQFSTQAESGMDDAQWANYQQQWADAKGEAKRRLDAAASTEAKLLANLRAKVVGEIDRTAAQVRQKVERDVRQQLLSDPYYKALSWMLSGRLSDDPNDVGSKVSSHQIDIDAAEKILGPADWQLMVQRYGTGVGTPFGRKHGFKPDQLAEMFEVGTGEQLLREMLRRPTLERAILDETNARMLRDHSQWENPDEREDLIAEALQGEMRERMFALEVVTMEEAMRRAADSTQGAGRLQSLAERMAADLDDQLGAARKRVKELEDGRLQTAEETRLRAELFAIRTELAQLRQGETTAESDQQMAKLTDQRRVLTEQVNALQPQELQTARQEASDLLERAEAARRLAREPMTSERIVQAAAAEAARRVVDETPLRDLRRLRRRAEQSLGTAARRGREAIRRGDIGEALDAARSRLRHMAIARQAIAAMREAERGAKIVRNLWKQRDDEKTAKRRDVDLVNAARAIAALFGMGTPAANQKDWVENLRKYNPTRWAEVEPWLQRAERAAAGLTPNAPRGLGMATDFRDLSLRELREVWDQIESLWDQSRRDHLIRVGEEMLAFDVVKARLLAPLQAQIDKHAGRPPQLGQADWRVRLNRHLSSLKAYLRRVDHWAESVGPAWQNMVVRPIREAVTRYRLQASAEVRTYQLALERVAATITQPQMLDWVIDTTDAAGQPLQRTMWRFGRGNGGNGMLEVIGALLHCGNESNYRKLLLGYGWAEETDDGVLDDREFREFLDELWQQGKLTRAHMDFVQGVWDQLERLKPAAQHAHREVFGTYFKEVEAREFVGAWGVMRGGYVPARIDPLYADPGAQRYASMEELRQDFRSSMPATASGFRHERVEGYTRRLNLQPSMIARHIDEQIRFSVLQPTIRDTLRIINDGDIAGALQTVDHSAKELMLLPWLQRVANQSSTKRGALPIWDRFVSSITRNSVLASMAFSISQALQNTANVFPALLKVGPVHLAGAFGWYLHNPMEATREVRKASAFMRAKVEANLRETHSRIRSIELAQGDLGKGLEWMRLHSQFLMQTTQSWGEIIAWRAAYQQHLAQRKGWATEDVLHADAVAHADSIVIQSQGDQNPESQAAYATGTPLIKALFLFQGYFSTMANWNATSFARLYRDMGWKMVYSPRTAMAWFLGMAAPMFVGDAIARMLTDRWDDEEDDDWTDPVLRSFTASQWGGFTAMVPGVGPILRAGAASYDDKPFNDRIDVSPVISALTMATIGSGRLYGRLEAGKPFEFRQWHDLATMMTVWSGVPFSAVTKNVRMLGLDD